ncbi:myb-like protein F [Apis laboriosa]|uniref:myb-like protein F n=1 Tax=Apis laboriosa TaxID=183418 RepID=UPI001CC34407|nr:myb-like protein F [Apis laboriosa]
MNIYVRPPDPLSDNGDIAQNWKQWKKDFMIFMNVTNSMDKPKEQQAYLLRSYIGKIGQNAIEKIISTNLKERDDMNVLLAKLDKYFCPSKNEVIERYNFFNSRKKKDESIETYITQLKSKAKTCNFGKITESLIRDKIIMEINDKNLKTKIFNTENLNLLTLIKIFNEHQNLQKKKEENKIKNDTRSDNASFRNTPKIVKNFDEKTNKSNNNEKSINMQNKRNCKKCNQRHPIKACPAWGLKCEKCGMYNHYTNCCPTQFNEKKEQKSNIADNMNLQKENLQIPSAPPFLDIDPRLYPNLDHVKISQERMMCSQHIISSTHPNSWSWIENKNKIINENLQNNNNSLPSVSNMNIGYEYNMEVSEVKKESTSDIDQNKNISKNKCRIS